jgi:16S rRNA (uracil1498-N3)-methyltransferase
LRDAEIHLLVTPHELSGASLEVVGDAFRHLFRARRLASGQRLRVVDGAGAARWAVVEEVARSAARLRLLEAAPSRDPAVSLELAVAVIRPERAAWVVEKATELGVRAVRFFPCARSQPFRDRASDRMARVASAALEQCGGATLPNLAPLGSFEELVALASERRCVLLDASGSPQVPAFADRSASVLLLVVGPEGGLVEGEVGRLHDVGAQRLSLGPRTLRTETAALVGAALLLQQQLALREGSGPELGAP